MKELEGLKFPDSLSAVSTNLFTETIKCCNGYISVHNVLWISFLYETKQAQFYWFSNSLWWIRCSALTNPWETEASLSVRRLQRLDLLLQQQAVLSEPTCGGWFTGVENRILAEIDGADGLVSPGIISAPFFWSPLFSLSHSKHWITLFAWSLRLNVFRLLDLLKFVSLFKTWSVKH